MAICYARKHGAARIAEDFAQYVFLRRAIKPGYIGRLQNFLYDFLRQELGDSRREKHKARHELKCVSIDDDVQIADCKSADVVALENKIIHPMRWIAPEARPFNMKAPTMAEMLKSLEDSFKSRGIEIPQKRDNYVTPRSMLSKKSIQEEENKKAKEREVVPRPFGRPGNVFVKKVIKI